MGLRATRRWEARRARCCEQGRKPLHAEETGKVCGDRQDGRPGGPREERARGLLDLINLLDVPQSGPVTDPEAFQ